MKKNKSDVTGDNTSFHRFSHIICIFQKLCVYNGEL